MTSLTSTLTLHPRIIPLLGTAAELELERCIDGVADCRRVVPEVEAASAREIDFLTFWV